MTSLPASRKACCAWLLLLFACIATGTMNGVVAARPQQLPQATDLAADRLQADREQKVILLLVSQDHCPFCHQIKREIIRPMIAAGDHSAELLIRELFIDAGSSLRDFSGNAVDGADFAHRYGVDLTPTLLFLDPDGRELTDRLVGMQTPDFFYFYVEQSIKQAISAMREAS